MLQEVHLYIETTGRLSCSTRPMSNTNTMDLYNFGKNLLSTTKSEICKRRIFKYTEAISRNNNIYYKPVDNIRSIHSVRVLSDGRLLLHVLHVIYVWTKTIMKNVQIIHKSVCLVFIVWRDRYIIIQTREMNSQKKFP